MSPVDYVGLELGKIWTREIRLGVVSDSSRAFLYILSAPPLKPAKPATTATGVSSRLLSTRISQVNQIIHFPGFSHEPLVFCLRPTYV